MNKDQLKGRVQAIKGRAKAILGAVTGDKVTQAQGESEQAKGALRAKVGDVKRQVASAVEKSDVK